MKVDHSKAHVFEGGGGKGVAYVGVSEHYQKNNYIPGNIAGVSAGSIYALFVALGYKKEEIAEFFNEKVNGKNIFSTFYDLRNHNDLNGYQGSFLKLILVFFFPFLRFSILKPIGWIIFKILSYTKIYRVIYSLRMYGGIYKGENLRNWILEKVKQKIDKERPTFLDLYEYNSVFLCIGSTNISTPDKQFCVFNYRSSPHLPLDEAVVMSSAIPFFFENREWKKEYGVYGIKHKSDFKNHKFIDGGTMSNSPIWIFTDRHMNIVGELPESLDITCFVLDENKEVKGFDEIKKKSKSMKFFSSKIGKSIHDALDAILASDNIKIYVEYERVCRIPCKGYKTYAFDLREEERDILIKSSIIAIDSYFEER